MPFSYVASAVGAINAVDSALNAVDTVGSWFDDGSGTPQQRTSSGSGGSGGSGGLPASSSLTPQIIKGNAGNWSNASGFTDPVAGHADGGYIDPLQGSFDAENRYTDPVHGTFEHLPSSKKHHQYTPYEAFSADGGVAHFAEGGHNPEFFSEGGIKHRYVQGEGDGTSDSVPAMLANGEFVIPADIVSALGNGSNNSGASVLDQFLETIRTHKQEHDPKELPPDSKGPLEYLNISAVTKAK